MTSVDSVGARRRLDARVIRQRAYAAGGHSASDLSSAVPGQHSAELADRARAQAPFRSALARSLKLPSLERMHRDAASREVHVASLLATLGIGWCAVHGVPLHGTDSDSLPVHLLIGRGGAYAVVATASRADVLVDGDLFVDGATKRAEVLRARRRAYRAATALSAACGSSVAVSGLVLVGTPRSVSVVQAPHRVEVVPEADLPAWVTSRPALLTDQQVHQVHAAARRSDTWLV